MRRLLTNCLFLIAALITPVVGIAPAGAQETDAAVSIDDLAFSPPTIEIPTGGTVTWTNNDTLPHTVTAADGSFDSGILGPDDAFSRTFDEPGVYAYRCDLHPRMTATVIVGDEGSTAGRDGSAAVDALDVGRPVFELVGRLDWSGDEWTAYGFLSHLPAVDDAALFADPDPATWDEATARLTFFATGEPGGVARVEDQFGAVDGAGSLALFFQDRGGASFDAPESFAAGTRVAEAEVRLHVGVVSGGDDRAFVDGTWRLGVVSAVPVDLLAGARPLGESGAAIRVDFAGAGAWSDLETPAWSVALAGVGTSLPPGRPAGPGPEATTDRPPEGTVTIAMEELDGSGVSGEATLTATEDGSEIAIRLDGALGGHPTHVHLGACDNLDPNPAFPLNDVDATGASVTTLAVPLAELQAGGYALNVHASQDDIGTYIACGTIPPP